MKEYEQIFESINEMIFYIYITLFFFSFSLFSFSSSCLPTFLFLFVCVSVIRLLCFLMCVWVFFLFVYLLARSFGQCVYRSEYFRFFLLTILLFWSLFRFVHHFFRSNFICLTTKSCFGFTDKFHRVQFCHFSCLDIIFHFVLVLLHNLLEHLATVFLLTFFIFLYCFCFHLPLTIHSVLPSLPFP